jgi:hypothetical protein
VVEGAALEVMFAITELEGAAAYREDAMLEEVVLAGTELVGAAAHCEPSRIQIGFGETVGAEPLEALEVVFSKTEPVGAEAYGEDATPEEVVFAGTGIEGAAT